MSGGFGSARVRGVLEEVMEERVRQHAKWGVQNLPDFDIESPLFSQREKLRARRHWNDLATKGGTLSFKAVLEEEFLEVLNERDPAKLRAELVQVAAVAVQWIEAIDRRGGR